MNSKKSASLAALAVLLLPCLVPLPVAAADNFQISPLPLAKNAKRKPDETPEAKRERELQAISTRASVMLGLHDYDALERLAQDWAADYQAKKIGADEYATQLAMIAPTRAGKSLLDETVAWTTARPKSYAAYYALGSLYYFIAGEERGARYANNTTAAQFAAMKKYADLSHEAFVTSLKLAERPIPTYSMMMKAATLSSHSGASSMETLKGIVAPLRQQRICPAVYVASGFPTSWGEQIYYQCASLRDDPNATTAFRNLSYFASPRWGGNFARLEALLEEIRKDGRTTSRAFGVMRSELWAQEAVDAAEFANSPDAAAQLYVKAFDAAPLGQNLVWLSLAAELERDKVKDLDRSLAIYGKLVAFREGEYDSIAQIGWIYEQKGDMKKYMEGMIAAANLGMKEAQNNVGYFYMVGQRGLPRDLRQAKEWLTLAANQGFEHSREKLGLVDAMIAREKTQ